MSTRRVRIKGWPKIRAPSSPPPQALEASSDGIQFGNEVEEVEGFSRSGCGNQNETRGVNYAGVGPYFHLPGQPILEFRLFEPGIQVGQLVFRGRMSTSSGSFHQKLHGKRILPDPSSEASEEDLVMGFFMVGRFKGDLCRCRTHWGSDLFHIWGIHEPFFLI